MENINNDKKLAKLLESINEEYSIGELKGSYVNKDGELKIYFNINSFIFTLVMIKSEYDEVYEHIAKGRERLARNKILDLLKDKYGITWWDSWDVGDRTIGQRYGATVKRYDLINKLLNGLKNEPYGRRHIINLYQYQDFDDSDGLYPCAMETQWSVRDGYLDMTLIQRSSDLLVANAINKIQYVALQMMVARHVGLKPGTFWHYVNNAHIYDRHIIQAEEILKREPQENSESIRLVLNPKKTNFYDFTIDDFTLENYNPVKPNLKFELAI